MAERRNEMGKKILVLGTGAQGSTVAQRMDEEDNVDRLICADTDHKAVDELVKILKKAEGAYVDANDTQSIIKAAEGVDLIVNALPIRFAPMRLLPLMRTIRTLRRQMCWMNGGLDALRSCTMNTAKSLRSVKGWR